MAALIQIVYSSQPFGFDTAMLNGILIDARRRNEKEDVTGALLCRRDIYLQMLEGPGPVVEETLERIVGDDRHVDVTLRLRENISARTFANWAMLHEVQPAMWSKAEIDKGAFEQANPSDFKAVFEIVAQKAQHKAP